MPSRPATARRPAPLSRGARAGMAAPTAKQEEKRTRLIEAAARVIGRYGYAGCSIARITSKARVAHGTFYLYFSSQQELFDIILPTMGAEFLSTISEAIRGASTFIEIENRGFRANLEYSVAKPYYNRLLWEAELFAPRAYRRYMDDVINRYTASLRRSKESKTLLGFADDELEMLAIMLIGARTQLTRCIAGLPHVSEEQIEHICALYAKFISHGPGGRG